jgi:Exonuclease
METLHEYAVGAKRGEGKASSAYIARIERRARDMNQDTTPTKVTKYAAAVKSKGLGSNFGHMPLILPFRAAKLQFPSLRFVHWSINMSAGTSPGRLTYYDGPLVWIDCEMTGLDYKTDRILEIAVSCSARTRTHQTF